ncbi:hypothetical protein NL676_033486 [Syzygium grande]|nr:hypothetical protein NL676_033486 [Syzygium grande]
MHVGWIEQDPFVELRRQVCVDSTKVSEMGHWSTGVSGLSYVLIPWLVCHSMSQERDGESAPLLTVPLILWSISESLQKIAVKILEFTRRRHREVCVHPEDRCSSKSFEHLV